MTESSNRYEARGASASKPEVHAAIAKLNKGLFPGAFCKIIPDVLGQSQQHCNVIHADGCGTKSILAYLHYKQTGDPSAFANVAIDSIIMNVDDLLCVGVTDNILISSTINRNARTIDASILKTIIEGTESCLEHLRGLGINIISGGGETADVGDIVQTVSIDSCAVARIRRERLIDAQNLKAGLDIVGLAAYGQSSYELAFNSGISSNGLTAARHELLGVRPENGSASASKAKNAKEGVGKNAKEGALPGGSLSENAKNVPCDYKECYPETCDSSTEPQWLYAGPYQLESPLPLQWFAGESHNSESPMVHPEMTIGQALLCPTRTYAPLVKAALKAHAEPIAAIIHCSGGGQSKCLRFGRGIHFIKDNLLSIPPIFTAIQAVGPTSWREMYSTYNMGHRMEFYCEPSATASLIQLAESFNIAAARIGRTEPSRRADGANHLSLTHSGEVLPYCLAEPEPMQCP